MGTRAQGLEGFRFARDLERVMHGPTGKELGCFLVFVAIVGGLLCVGIEHGVACIWHHLSVEWK